MMTEHEKEAGELFLSGCNCAQAITVAFRDKTGLSEELSKKMAAAFGGGIGRMHEVCGAVSGMLMVVGLLYGYTDPGEKEINKREHYKVVRYLADQFREQTGSIICREILKTPPTEPDPEPVRAEMAKVRPCARIVMTAARVLDEYIAEHPVAAE